MNETLELITILTYCPVCWDSQEHVFIRDEGIHEVYQCQTCGNENRKAVR